MGLDLQSFEWPLILALVWTLPWKGVALWKAAKNGHMWWFVAMLVLNTLAALEIIYIFFFSKKNSKFQQKPQADS